MARKIHLLKHKEESFRILALACHEPVYRLCWLINQSFGLNMNRSEDLVVPEAGTLNMLEFARYFCTDEERMLEWYLISNHTANAYLVPGLKNVDFFLRLSGDLSARSLQEILAGLKTIEGILMAFEPDRKQLKDQSIFVF